MANISSIPETQKHIKQVQYFAQVFCNTLKEISRDSVRTKYYKHIEDSFCFLLEQQVNKHDASKMEPPEVEVFDEYTSKLKTTTYGSEEYKSFLIAMKPALDHHYKINRHHPEHFPNGISGMTLIDLVELFCDWKAASMRHKDGDLKLSIEKNSKERPNFNIQGLMKKILLNSVGIFEPPIDGISLIDLVIVLCEWQSSKVINKESFTKLTDYYINVDGESEELTEQIIQILTNSASLFE